jgi:16S rRNA pseudouridine516 synthase
MSKAPTARLDRLLANMAYGSRREIQQMMNLGWIVLDGKVLGDAAQRVPITPDLSSRMTIQGKPLDPPAPLTLMLHKPLGHVCSHKEDGPRIYDLLPPRWRSREPALSSIGRLDKDTSGLILITDDGALLHRVISPRHHVAKRYHVTLDRPLVGHEVASFASGTLMLESEDKPVLPAALEILDSHQAHLTLMEGRYHQVRRMFAAVGNHITALHRNRIGGLGLPDDLANGAYRLLTAQDLAAIFVKPLA